MRHGFEDEYNSEAYLSLLDQVFYMYYTEKRHEARDEDFESLQPNAIDWRMKDRLKTVSAALVICLNIGTDPPDIIKPDPCCKLECWVDISAQPSAKALENVGKNLQQQYETLSFRTRYKQYLDPHYETTRKFCTSLRRSAKEERILFHYNGHGVPKPTLSGEIWVFNQTFTQYIPVPLHELHAWLGCPTIYVWECNNAGNVLRNLERIVERDRTIQDMQAVKTQVASDCIQLAACSEGQLLPMNPRLPCDIFTSCLTTPIDIAVRFYLGQNTNQTHYLTESTVSIPGRLQERRTPLGELNWIFTAITDTIAWNNLPRSLFKRLFRQDLMVAALFRNFLLSQRLLRFYGCKPVSSPLLPELYHSSLWDSWDLALENCLCQLSDILVGSDTEGSMRSFRHSTFFADQLTAFEIYLDRASIAKEPPTELPIVLQVLLSQVHRLRALVLLSKFLDLGPWAVNLALEIGIFPYVLKLLQSAAPELRPVLVYIWARLLAVDGSCQADLLKDNGFAYFFQIFSSGCALPPSNIGFDYKAMCAFILTSFCRDFKPAQTACLNIGLLESAQIQITGADNPLLRQWACLAIAELCRGYTKAVLHASRIGLLTDLCTLIGDPVPEVRAAAVYTLASILGSREKAINFIPLEEFIVSTTISQSLLDGSILVRRELLMFVSKLSETYRDKLEAILLASILYGDGKTAQRPLNTLLACVVTSAHSLVWSALLVLCADPYPAIASASQLILAKFLSCTLNQWVISGIAALLRKRSLRTVLPGRRPLSSGNMVPYPRQLREFPWLYKYRWNMASPRKPIRNVEYYEHRLGQSTDSPGENKSPRSNFLEWCMRYFQEPQMRPPEADEPGSIEYNNRLWKRTRNERIILQTQPQKERGAKGSWDALQSQVVNRALVSSLLFHQFENHLIAVGIDNSVSVWDHKRSLLLNRFYADSSPSARVTGIKFMNEDDTALLAVATLDGVVRIYKNYESAVRIRLIAAWQAGEALPTHAASDNFVCEWLQGCGTMLTAGDFRTIKIWQAPREVCISEIPVRSPSSVTSITAEQVAGNVFVAGFGDGSLRVYDRRTANRDGMLSVWRNHKSPILSINMQRGGDRELVSASKDGEVKLWDIRYSQPCYGFKPGDKLAAVSIHEHAPLLSTSAGNGEFSVWDISNVDSLERVRQGKRCKTVSSPLAMNITALCFHPHRMILAVGSVAEANLSVFECDHWSK
ncbi:WD40 repeat-like protein [Ascobolus immersus RN42]|uniref:WD40 repeat-like protein n=1 Tax=Ascobolus immersus RN42 TaxID=1160509 RepID=A0A3N4I8K9_ASCIM|nr:WD40 repeat-like protein [Ascobolus immersus RN42]